jgi:hypothetical protein
MEVTDRGAQGCRNCVPLIVTRKAAVAFSSLRASRSGGAGGRGAGGRALGSSYRTADVACQRRQLGEVTPLIGEVDRPLP